MSKYLGELCSEQLVDIPETYEPGVVNWGLIWTQVGWIAAAGVVVGVCSYIENYTGHYVAFKILAAFRAQFYFSMLPLAPAKTATQIAGLNLKSSTYLVGTKALNYPVAEAHHLRPIS